MRIRRRRLLLCIAGIGLLVVSLWLLVTSSSFQQRLLRRVESWAANAGFPFTASRLRLDLTELSASLDNVAYDKDGQRIRVEQLRIDLPWSALRGEGLRITSLEADGVTLNLNAPETAAASTSTAASQPGAPPRFQIDRMAIRNASVSYSTPTMAVKIPSVSIEAINHRGTIRFDAPASIGPDTTVTLGDVPVAFDNESAQFGPAPWKILYTTYAGSGSASGKVRWSPSIGVDTDFTTDPITLQAWKDLRLNAKVSYADGTLTVSEFRANQGNGEATGSARLSGQSNSATVTWKDLRLDPTGLKARTDGSLNLQWQKSDFSDLSGDGQTTVNSADYGRFQSGIKLTDAKAQLEVRADTKDLTFRGQIHTELQSLLRGNFRELRATVRGNGRLLGQQYDRIGPVNLSATALFRDKVLSVRNVRASAKGSRLSSGDLQVNTATRNIRGKVPELLVNVPDLIPEAGGTVRLSADIGGSVSKPTASFMASSADLSYRNVTSDNIQLAGDLAPDASGVNEIRATLSGTVHPLGALPANGSLYQGFNSINISANGTFRDSTVIVSDIRAQARASSLSGATFQFNLNDEQLSGKLPELQFDLSDVSSDTAGTVRLSAELAGTADKPTASFTGSSSGLDILGEHIDTVGLHGEFAEDTLVVTRLEARQGDGLVTANGSANLATEAVAAEARLTNLKLTQIEDLSATAFLQARATGTYRMPSVTFDGEVQDVTYQEQGHGDIQFEGSTDVKTGTLVVKSPKYSASATGTITLEAPFVFSAALTSTDSHLPYGNYNMVADGRVRLSGEARPFKARNLEFDSFRLRGEGIDLVANGPINPGARVDAKVDLSELPLEGVELEGDAQMIATVSGTLENPFIEGGLKTAGAKVKTMRMSTPADLSAQVDFAGNEISIRGLTAAYAGATATVTGKGSWDGAGQLQFRIDNVKPENLLPGRPISGLASAEGNIDIKSPSLEGISGNLRVTTLDLTVREATIRQTQPIEAELRNQLLTVRQFEIEGLDTHARLTGHVDLRDYALHLDAVADTDLAILQPFIPRSDPAGRIESKVSLRGTAEKPLLEGFINVSDGELAITTPDIFLSEVDVEAELRGDRIEIGRATGLINGGTFKASGGTGVSSAGLNDAALQVSVERSQVEFPEGLQSEVTSELKLSGTMPNLTLSGTVDVLNAVYRKDYNLTQQLFAQITTPLPQSMAAPGLSNQVRMEVEVRTPGPIIVKNNVADLEASGAFRVRGTVGNPILLGRANVVEGGELYFGPTINTEAVETGRRSDRYTIERGSIDFNNSLRTEPDLDFRATHELEIEDERYLITLEVTGTPETLKAELTSDPYMEQNDIISMLLTGRTFDELQGTYASFAGEQALGYVSGQLSEKYLSQAGAVLGLNTVRIDPVTVANQTDVAARLTLAKDFTPEFSLVYSQYLNSAEAQTWIASYKPFRNFVLRAVNDAEQNEVLVDMKHELRFGSGSEWLKPTRPQNETKLRNVTFTGSQFTEKELRKQVTSEGDPWVPFRVNQDMRNLRLFLASKGFPSARVQAQQNTAGGNVDVRYDITEGPRTVFAYEGASVPDNLQREILQIWTLRSSNNASLRDSTNRLLRHFRDEGYLQVKISVENLQASGERRYVFKIVPGQKFDKPAWVFHGVEPIAIPETAGVVMEAPETIEERIESHFRTEAYLDVSANTPNLVINGNKAQFEITVDRGSSYTIESIGFEGNKALDSQLLLAAVTLPSKESETTETRFTSAWLESARQRITSEYWKRGYNDVQIVPSTTPDSKAAKTAVLFSITEGEGQVIEAIEITGANRTNRGYIQRQFQFKEGDPVDFTKVNLTRKRLYDMGVFRRVEIEVVPGSKGYTARVNLNERDPWQLRYGLSVTEHLDNGNRSVGVSTDLSYNNFLGRGLTVGVSGKLNTDERDGRVFGSIPQLFGKKVTTSMTLFRTRDLTDPEDVVDYWGTTIQQQWRFRQRYLLSYDYSYRKVLSGERTQDRDLEEGDTVLDDPRVPIARFGVALSRDTRDDILNATRGSFLSNSFEIAPPNIGSSIEFYRNFSQVLYFKPVKKLVLASAFRFGWVKALNNDVLDPTLQYEAGGSTTVRAFKQDELTREPGNYELILNQEVRFPLFWKFSGVTFLDVGQVSLKSKNIFNFRYAPGVGIRIQTPFVILRTDLGINIDRRPGEHKGRWTFGIGQAF